jgi:hypothetical protein
MFPKTQGLAFCLNDLMKRDLINFMGLFEELAASVSL